MPYKDPAKRKAYQKEYRAANKDKTYKEHRKKWRAENKDKLAANTKRYVAKNKEKVEAYRKDYYAKNKENFSAHNKEYRAANKEAAAEYNKNYAKKNKDKYAVYKSRRRAKKKGNGIFIVSEKFMKNLYNSPCVSCGASEAIEADHIIPIVKGGRHSEGNLQPLCKSCNSTKGPKLWIDFVSKKRVA